MSSYLPMSQRPRRDESAVTNDWAKARAAVFAQLAGLLDELSDEAMDAPALVTPWTVRDLAADALLLARATAADRARNALRSEKRAIAARLGKARQTPLNRTELASRLRALATDDPASQVAVGQLGEAVVALLDIAASTSTPASVDPIVSGAVALNRALAGPAAARAVVRERTLVATDAEWRVGHGRVVEGSAAEIVLFLYGRGARGL